MADRVSWDAQRYCDSLNRQGAPVSGTEDELLRLYPPLNPAEEIISDPDGTFPVIHEPTAITDPHGHVLVVSLPSVLTPARQVRHLSCQPTAVSPVTCGR